MDLYAAVKIGDASLLPEVLDTARALGALPPPCLAVSPDGMTCTLQSGHPGSDPRRHIACTMRFVVDVWRDDDPSAEACPACRAPRAGHGSECDPLRALASALVDVLADVLRGAP